MIIAIADGRQRFWRFNIGLRELLEDLWDAAFLKYQEWVHAKTDL
jgi:hypothetical protein